MEQNYDLLTEKQKTVYDLYTSGLSQTDIAKKISCSRQNVNIILKKSIDIIENGKPNKNVKRTPHKNPPREHNSRLKSDYARYLECDLSALTELQTQILSLRAEGYSYKEIAEKLNITYGIVSSSLEKIRMKFDEKEEDMRNYKKTYMQDYMDKHRDELKEYQRKYHLLNRKFDSKIIKPGARIGFLKILRDTGKTVKAYKIWECECLNCGKIIEKSTEQLRTARSCGCYRKERMSIKGKERQKLLHPNPSASGAAHSLRNLPNKNNHSSGIRGVTWDKTKGKWSVQIMHNKKAYNLGRFDNIADASKIRHDAEDAVRENRFDTWISEYKSK